MLDAIYRIGRLFTRKAWFLAFVIITLTVVLGTRGFLDISRITGQPQTFWDALYQAVSLLAIESGGVPARGNWQFEVARWLGMLFWGSALLTVVIKLFQDAVNRLLVRALARDHVIVAGLGQNGVRLVEALRKRQHTVVVLEPDRNHPSASLCRQLGAIVLFGEPDDAGTLLTINLPYAKAIVALFLSERECVRIATAAYKLLHSEKATRKKPPVRCVLRLIEPGLLDVVRRHSIKTDPTDRIQLEILNSHEIAATTMVREALANSAAHAIRSFLILGLGARHRLGEMVVLRAAKDHLISSNGEVAEKLVIHVYDREAADWATAFRSRYPFVDRVCTIAPHGCWARKVGADAFEDDYDAAFVCIPDEGHATAQASMLRRNVLTRGQPIMVRVVHSHSGYGQLIEAKEAGWGENIHAVGLEDSLFDPDMATHPELELRAQTLHHDYRARQKDDGAPANKAWEVLEETYREANRKLADRYASHLAYTNGDQKQHRYKWKFQPDGFTQFDQQRDLLFRFSDDELETLAAREHHLWKREREDKGWTYGLERSEHRKTHPLLVDYSRLDEPSRERNREFIRSIPRILALADYAIVPDTDSASEKSE